MHLVRLRRTGGVRGHIIQATNWQGRSQGSSKGPFTLCVLTQYTLSESYLQLHHVRIRAQSLYTGHYPRPSMHRHPHHQQEMPMVPISPPPPQPQQPQQSQPHQFGVDIAGQAPSSSTAGEAQQQQPQVYETTEFQMVSEEVPKIQSQVTSNIP